MFSFISKLPQPSKTLYLLIVLSFIGFFASFFLGSRDVTRTLLIVLGTLFALLGISAALNVNRTAEGMAESIKDYHPMGVDYSKSFLATPLYARLFGVGAFLVGSTFAVTALLNPDVMR